MHRHKQVQETRKHEIHIHAYMHLAIRPWRQHLDLWPSGPVVRTMRNRKYVCRYLLLLLLCVCVCMCVWCK